VSTRTADQVALDGMPGTPDAAPLLEVRDLVQEFTVRGHGGVKGGVVHAVSGVSFALDRGETLGIVGESGSGKSTLVRSVLQVPPPKSGSVVFDGVDLAQLKRRELLSFRRRMQMVFQDPYNSVDPTWQVSRIVEEPMMAAGVSDRRQRRQRVAELLDLVGLDMAQHGSRRARELSGGQCQRVAIARALALDPALIICDEAVSALDVLVQAQILNLFEQLRDDFQLSYLFVAHDLVLVKQVSDRVAVMYLGKLCELGPADALYERPLHPYTVALLAAIPRPDPDEPAPDASGLANMDPPSPLDPPSGCRYRTRCPLADEKCAAEVPELRSVGADPSHLVACHHPTQPVAAE
jgi:oligopeptide/dipeptide ABC transporter ATP-binding protein